LGKAVWAARAFIVALFALAQLVPPGFALASDGDGVELVICTADGPKSVSWEEFTGEPSPFDQPSGHEKPDCAACHTTCRVGAAVQPGVEQFSYATPQYSPADFPGAATEPDVRKTLPPMPSRAPPTISI